MVGIMAISLCMPVFAQEKETITIQDNKTEFILKIILYGVNIWLIKRLTIKSQDLKWKKRKTIAALDKQQSNAV